MNCPWPHRRLEDKLDAKFLDNISVSIRMGEPHSNKKHALLYPALVCWPAGTSENLFEGSKLVVDRLAVILQFSVNTLQSLSFTLHSLSPLSLLSYSHSLSYFVFGRCFWSGATASQWSGCWSGTTRSRPSVRTPRRAPGKTLTGRSFNP